MTMLSRRDLLTRGAQVGAGGFVASTVAGTASARPNSFVRTDGPHFTVDGQIQYFNGTDNFWIMGPWATRSEVDDFFGLASELGLDIVRTWGWCAGESGADHCLQPTEGEIDQAWFDHFDYVIDTAAQNDIRLIIPFTDYWGAYGGMAQYVEWSSTASSKEDFYTDSQTRQMYKAHVDRVLNHTNSRTGRVYRNDPTIAIWELANEPRATNVGASALQSWIEEMSAYIKSIDADHLVSTGSEGHYASGDPYPNDTRYGYDGYNGTDYIAFNRIDTIDACSFHLYPDHWWSGDHSRGPEWIRRHVTDAHDIIGKPAYLGEFGYQTTKGVASTSQARADTYSTYYDTLDEVDADGALLWELVQKWQTDTHNHDGFSVYIDQEPTVSEIRAYSQRVEEKSTTATTTRTPTRTAPSTTTPTPSDTTTPESPTWPTDPPATDPDGDGLYEDLSGNGQIDFPDVNTLFQNSDTANVQTNADFYDFESSGTINLQDVMALFQLV